MLHFSMHSQSTMESTPHYGKLDQKGGTLPGTVPPGDQYAVCNNIMSLCQCVVTRKS